MKHDHKINRLFTPGPTLIPKSAIAKMSEPIIYHRSDEFREIFRRVNKNLGYLFQTRMPVLTFTSSGTGAMEAIIVNLFSSGEKVISVNGGKFGERWGIISRTYGLNVVEINIGWGNAVSVEVLEKELRNNPDTKGVLLTHCETSTGTANDVKNLSRIIRENSDALIIVDGISSIGTMEFRFDDWGIDACITASQKGLMLPPGLAFVVLSECSIKACKKSTLPKYYFDFQKAVTSLVQNDTPWTPAITLIKGLDATLQMIVEEKLENVWKRHEKTSKLLRNGLEKLGLKIFSKNPSNAVTAVIIPEGIQWDSLNKALLEKHQIVISSGQGAYLGKIFRIAHIGLCNEKDIISIINFISMVMINSKDVKNRRKK